MFPPVGVSQAIFSLTINVLILMSVLIVPVNQPQYASTQSVHISANVPQEQSLMHLVVVVHLTNVFRIMIVQRQQHVIMANVRTLVRYLDPVAPMPSVHLLIIVQCVLVHQELMEILKFDAFHLNVLVMLIVIARELVSGISVLMSAVYPMYVVKTPTAEPQTILPDVSVYLDSLEIQHLAVLSSNCVRLRSNVHQECYAALEFALLHVNHHETVWTINSVMEVPASASVKTQHNVHLFTAVKMDYVFKNPGVPMMLTVMNQIPVLEEKMAFSNVRMHVLVPLSAAAMHSVPRRVIKHFVPVQMDSLEIQTMRRLVVRKSNVLSMGTALAIVSVTNSFVLNPQ